MAFNESRSTVTTV